MKCSLLTELTESFVQGALVGGGGSVLGLGSDIGGRQVSLFPSNSGISSRYRVIFLTGPPLKMSLYWPPPNIF